MGANLTTWISVFVAAAIAWAVLILLIWGGGNFLLGWL